MKYEAKKIIKTNSFFFSKLKKAIFLSRPNRFVVNIKIGTDKMAASLPNTGKLSELLLPGVTLLVSPVKNPECKYPFKVAAVFSNSSYIMIDTHVTNDCIEFLLEKKAIPSLSEAKILKREVKIGRSRLDFLLETQNKKIYCEVKSCTLFGDTIGMFPDALSERATRHINELAELKDSGFQVVVIILIQSAFVDTFIPNYHTDLLFAKTLYQYRDKLTILPISLGWSTNLIPKLPVKEVTVPWHILKKEAHNSGCYIILLFLDSCKTIKIGKLGELSFKKGYYCYVGSATRNLTQRIERHKRVRKKQHWHIDYLRSFCKILATYPIRSSEDLECKLALSINAIAQKSIKHFGCSDCSCLSHLFFFKDDPRHVKKFHDILLDFKVKRLSRLIKEI